MKAMSAATLIVLDRNADALSLAASIGADHTFTVDDSGSSLTKSSLSPPLKLAQQL